MTVGMSGSGSIQDKFTVVQETKKTVWLVFLFILRIEMVENSDRPSDSEVEAKSIKNLGESCCDLLYPSPFLNLSPQPLPLGNH